MGYTVYKITGPTGKVYIGATSQTLEKRFADGRGYVFNEILYKDIKKYGWGSFQTETLYTTTDKTEAQLLEKMEIKNHDSTSGKGGYNCSKGVAIKKHEKYDPKHNPMNDFVPKKQKKTNDHIVLIFDLAEKILLLNRIDETHSCGQLYRNQLKKVIMSKFEACDIKRVKEENRLVDEIKRRMDNIEVTLFLSADEIVHKLLGSKYDLVDKEFRTSLLKENIYKLRKETNICVDVPKRYKITLV
jgi:hypothetical protein